MTITRQFLQGVREAERPFIRQAIELGKHFAEVRKRVADEGGDWGALKAVLKAEIMDEEGGEHLKKLLERATSSNAYADMLNMNNKSFSSSNGESSPPPTARASTVRAAEPRDDSPPQTVVTAPQPSTPSDDSGAVADASSATAPPNPDLDIRNQRWSRSFKEARA